METLRAWGSFLFVFVVLLLAAWFAGLVGNPLLKGVLALAGIAILCFCGYWFPKMGDVDGVDVRFFPGAGFIVGLVLLFSLWIHR